MICENTSLPTPLSPVINIDKLVGATRTATSNALLSAGAFPMIPNRCLTDCNSIF
jgi:hypothetical protein